MTNTYPEPSVPARADAPTHDPNPTPAAASVRPPAVDQGRPFGAHVRMSWWKPLVIVPLLIILMLVIQIVASAGVVMFEWLVLGNEPDMANLALSPLMMLAANLSIAAMAPISIALMRWIGKVPVREQFALARRASWGRLGVYTGMFLVLLLGVNAIFFVIDPSSLQAISLSGGVIALIVITLFTTPLQAAAEEIMFRGAIMPSVASWIRPAKVALVVGLVVSSIIFGIMHGSVDPWLLSYYTIFGAAMAAMAVISRGLEAPIALHVVNNVVIMVIGALGSDDGAIVIDRSVGMGGPFILAFIAMDLVAVALVWLYERRRRAQQKDNVRGGVAQPTA